MSQILVIFKIELLVYHVRIYVNYKWSYGSPNMCVVETFKLIKLRSKFQQLFIMFHEMYLSYHGQFLLKFRTWIDNGMLETFLLIWKQDLC